MKLRSLRLHGGEIITLHQMDNGHYACPVCGMDLGDAPPYAEGYGVDKQGRPTTEVFGMGSHDICPCCRTQFGDDDFPDAGQKTTAQMWEELRQRWLTQMGNRNRAVEQLRNIGIELS